MSDNPTIVLVHGGFVDGSGWQAVHQLLTAQGHDVRIVQNPTLSLEGDVAATRNPSPMTFARASAGQVARVSDTSRALPFRLMV